MELGGGEMRIREVEKIVHCVDEERLLVAWGTFVMWWGKGGKKLSLLGKEVVVG